MHANPRTDLLLVTTASGRQASALLKKLDGLSWKRLRLIVNSASSEERLREEHPKAEVIRADLSDAEQVSRIMDGVASVFHNTPPFHPDASHMTHNMVDAAVAEAKEGKLKHFVFSSVLNPQLRKMIHHDEKKSMEEYLMESGLNYTILQPTHFMDTFPVSNIMAQDNPVYLARWDPDVQFSYIAVKDVGEAAAKVIYERERHYGAQYPLASSDPPGSYTWVCKIFSRITGKEIKIKQLPLLEAVDNFVNTMYKTDDVHPYTRDCAERMLLYYNRRGLVGNSNVLEWLLERKSTGYAEWAQVTVDNINRS